MNRPTFIEPAESIAIIGMRGRFPGAGDLEQFWDNLCNGVESISTFTPDELRAAGVDPEAMLQIPGFVRCGAVLDGVGLFDAHFFGFSARDAELMDPQQRLFLELAHESLEDAGYDPDACPGLISVFGGADWSTYLYNIYANFDQLGYVDGMALAVGNDKDHLTTHVSYKLNLRGLSVDVQTACSTSLVTVCMACHSLLTYQSDLALAGGVAVSVPQKKGYFYQPGGIVSPDGHCRPFDAAGEGTVIGSGAGMVVLKRLSEALADGDHIHAVIRGSAINNDGAAKVGYTAPSVEGQAQVVAMAQTAAGVDPETITYIEAHGTATPLGDPIEVMALTQAFAARTDRKGFCGIGSLKSNVGHMASAAGIGGLIKTALCLEHGMLPPTLHYTRPNPQLDFASTPFYVVDRLTEWSRNGNPRRAGVSSFGIGGTNAHVVLEEAPPPEPCGPARPQQLLLLSAKSAAALERATDNLAAHLESHPDLPLAEVAYTLQVGRKAYTQRRALVCADGDPAEAARVLRERDPQRLRTAAPASLDRPVVFMFPGQGTQYVGMGLELYRTEPAFRDAVDHCSAVLRPHLELDLREVLYPAPEGAEAAAERLRQTALTQPALFTVEYALAALWMEWGVQPQAMIGHSIGEYVAACLAGVFALDDALALVAARGRLMDAMPPGTMLTLPLSEAEVLPFLNSAVSLAAVNGPGFSVLSGPTEAIGALEAQLARHGIQGRRLHTSHAFHSGMMDPIVDTYVEQVASVALGPPRIPFLSNVTGTWILPEEAADPAYWGRQLRQTVRFAAGMQELAAAGEWIAIEAGPGQTLSTLARQQPARGAEHVFLPSLRAAHDPPGSDTAFLLESVAQLWLAGTRVDWSGFHRHARRRRVPLPTYPFERQHYWLGASEEFPASPAGDAVREVGGWFYVPAWKPAPPRDGAWTADPAEAWLLFSDGGELGTRAAERLREAGGAVSTVRTGDGFARDDEGGWAIRPGEPADYRALVAGLREAGRLPRRILHLWSAEAGEGPEGGAGFPDALQHRGFYSLLYLARALEAENVSERIDIGMVCSGTQAVLGDEPLIPAKATVLGACKVVPQEYSNLVCRGIDVAADEVAGPGCDRLAERLVGEVAAEPFAAVVAYRRGRRWVQGYEPLRLEPAAGPPARLRPNGVYLITGGLGNLGLVLAGCLARSVQARLVLTGRSAFPEREEWEGWLEAHGDGETSRRIRALLELEELGAEVLVLSADAANPEQMRAVVEYTRACFGALHGVIHGAGHTTSDAFAPVGQVDEALGRAHFAPKAAGLLALDQALRGERLDFCLLLSSLSAVLGGLGLGPYAAANAYMDAFAARQNQGEGTPWISVNWDAWHFPAYGEASVRGDAIVPEEGADAFLRILEHAPGQVVVSTTDLQVRLDKWINLRTLRETQQSQGGAGTRHPRPNLSTQFVAPRSTVEEGIARIWEELLGVAPVGIHDRFFELGGHSLLAIQLSSRLRERFHLEVPVQRVFTAPTVAELAATVEQDLGGAAQAAGEPEPQRMEDILRLVEGLSDDEVMQMLAEAGALAQE
ncbi:MAG TPA: beta-ketoacyl synthase N-terminal-like domain-containing protein [Longimicrobium sp.]|nr:beta-ketoacyl synthase N-terminal-like domain-containing protein [Longimicrobium sp.]